MWTRAELKEKAKIFLRKNYWVAFGAALIMLITGAIGEANNGFEVGWNLNSNDRNTIIIRDNNIIFNPSDDNRFSFPVMILGDDPLVVPFVIAVSILFLAILFRLFLTYPIETGGKRFFLNGQKEDVDFSYVFSIFRSGNIMNIAKTLFFRDLYIVLWTLALIVPGIIKTYSYKMVPYILSENPEMETHEVLSISKNMTYGHKWDMFVLDLSFLGWQILGALLFGIGTLFVYPYIEATYAQLYMALSDQDETIYYQKY